MTAMTNETIALLPDRGVLRLGGADVRPFLQGLITSDVDRLDRDGAVYGGLLSPQGKILFEFFVVADGEAVLVDCERARAAELAKRLTFYRLRAKVEIADLSETHAVAAAWRADGGEVAVPAGAIAFADPRIAAMGVRLIGERAVIEPLASADAADYHRQRMAHGLADSTEIGSGEMFPHECNLDQLGGVDFTKGCYVGQEVVSRTEHRGTARKRIVPVSGSGLAPDMAITAAGKTVGTVLAAQDGRALALVRLDRAGEALETGAALESEGGPVMLHKPAWARFEVPGS
jgi:hypothetical protein